MTLNEIATQLDTHYPTWASAYKDDLERVSKDPVICHKLTDFITRAVSRTEYTTNPLEAITDCLRFSAMSTFKYGLLVGLLLRDSSLSPPEGEELGDQLEPCSSCNMSGQVCLHCGFSQFACECAPGKYSPVR